MLLIYFHFISCAYTVHWLEAHEENINTEL
jgi:hypothetical protein